jgi:hypothetical protein
MGGVFAKNEINSAINSAINILNQSSQGCTQNIQNRGTINATNCKTVDFKNIVITQQSEVDFKCVQNTSSKTDITAKVEEKFTEKAEAINQALSLNPGRTEASNIVRLMKNLSKAVTDSYSQECLTKIKNDAGVNVICPSGNSELKINTLTINQVAQASGTCVQNNVVVNGIIEEIKAEIDQTATAKVEALFGFGSIILLLLIFFLLFLQSGMSLVNIILVLVVLAILFGAIYLGVAYVFGYYPFNTV